MFVVRRVVDWRKRFRIMVGLAAYWQWSSNYFPQISIKYWMIILYDRWYIWWCIIFFFLNDIFYIFYGINICFFVSVAIFGKGRVFFFFCGRYNIWWRSSGIFRDVVFSKGLVFLFVPGMIFNEWRSTGIFRGGTDFFFAIKNAHPEGAKSNFCWVRTDGNSLGLWSHRPRIANGVSADFRKFPPGVGWLLIFGEFGAWY